MEQDFETRLKDKVLAYENKIQLQLQKENYRNTLTILIGLFVISIVVLTIVLFRNAIFFKSGETVKYLKSTTPFIRIKKLF